MDVTTAERGLMRRESGFRLAAQNPTSSAYGLWQCIYSTCVTAAKATNTEIQTTNRMRIMPGNNAIGHLAPFGEWLDDIHDLGMCLVRLPNGVVTLVVPYGSGADQIERIKYKGAAGKLYVPFLQALAADPTLPLTQAPPCAMGCGKQATPIGADGLTVICHDVDCTVPRPDTAKPKAAKKRSSRRQAPA